MSTLTVELGERSYPIHIESGIISNPNSIKPYLASNKAVVITNDVVKPLLLNSLLESLRDIEIDVIEIPDGEQHKNLAQFESIITRLLKNNASRDTTLIALGGGVIGDLTGFVAASFQRGMPFIQVPTTLLSQVDSSVGGKTAVNHPLGKNMIGAFYQPKAVVIDSATLNTLPANEFAAGMAEVIKYGIIYDAEFFAWLESNIDPLLQKSPEHLNYTIKKCCQIKADIVAQDERENDIRAILNLGHTFGHAIEAEMGFGNWLHGEAVAAGMVLACKTANKIGWMNETDLTRVIGLLKAFSLPVEKPAAMNCDDFVKHMQHDKKVKSGKIRFVIPKGIGHAVVTQDIDVSMLKNILN